MIDTLNQKALNHEIHEHGYWYGEETLSHHIFDEPLANALVDFFKTENIQSIVDFGCGTGEYVKTFLSHQLECIGYDGNPDTFNISKGVGKTADLSQFFSAGKKFEWVLSLEVGEHIPAHYEKIFIENLHRHNTKGIVLSWAVQGQGGFGHFNEQNNQYIKNIMARYGYINDLNAEETLRNCASLDYFKNTIMVFRQSADLKSQHWCRVVMNHHTEQFITQLGPSNLNVLEISGSAWRHAGFKTYEQVNYPDFDICKDRTLNTYDVIIAEQVLEHVRRPDLAAKNVLGMLKKDGVFLITTPFLIRNHLEPLDLWRWTKDGMRAFLTDAGFSLVESYSWGNRACVTANFDDWIDYNVENHSLENEPDFPLVVWAFARRSRSQTIVDRIITHCKAARRIFK